MILNNILMRVIKNRKKFEEQKNKPVITFLIRSLTICLFYTSVLKKGAFQPVFLPV